MPRPLQSALTRAASFQTPDRALSRAQGALGESRQQLATGLRITSPSDDPTGFAQARALGRHSDRLGQYGRAIDAAALWNDRTQAELDALGEVFSQANEVGLRAANGVVDADQLADQIEGLRDEAVARLRSEVNGEYLFAGNETRTAPLDEAGALAPGDFSGRRTREVAPGQTVAVNAVGALAVDGVAAPDRLQALADAVRAGDAEAVRAQLSGIREGVDHYARLGGQSGGVSRRLSAARAAVEAEAIVTDERRAQIEEVDVAQAYGQLTRRQTALEAALRATATVAQTSLLDYLR